MNGSGRRTKGSAGEREICQKLSEALKPAEPFTRNLDQVRDGGADIVALRPFAIEVKRQENLQLNAWKKQAIRQTTNKNPIAVLMYRQNRRPWVVLIDARAVLKKRFAPVSRGAWVRTDLEGFILIAQAMQDRRSS